ncbi:hypothetical protein RISK_006273 [Rhodopirellula islandica]|uniref:Uncharacterized protein n=1 Tax=Rhodopirellula islandica TaxID=595434 RepID=A0A0J1E8I5_RHOIS|nr:hypothetical protein RISK_006273 [Rhodopirellula islandica]
MCDDRQYRANRDSRRQGYKCELCRERFAWNSSDSSTSPRMGPSSVARGGSPEIASR